MGIPDCQGLTIYPADLASEAGTSGGSYPGVLPGIRVVESARWLDAAIASGGRTAHRGRGVRTDTERRCCPTNSERSRESATDHPSAVCDRARRRPEGVTQPTGIDAASPSPSA